VAAGILGLHDLSNNAPHCECWNMLKSLVFGVCDRLVMSGVGPCPLSCLLLKKLHAEGRCLPRLGVTSPNNVALLLHNLLKVAA